MMKKYIIIIGILINTICLYSQWISNYGGNTHGDNPVLNAVGISINTDDDGNSYVAGYISKNVSDNDIILIKYGRRGDTLFTRTYNGNASGNDRAFGIAVDEDGNIYIIGQTEVIGRALDLILLKYSNDGNLLWEKTYGATNEMKDDIGRAIIIDGENNIYITGFVTDYDDFKDIVIIKYSPNGACLWQKSEDGEGNLDSEGLGIAVDEKNNIYITGYTASVNNLLTTDIITLKYASDGNLSWTAIYNGVDNEEDKAFGISIDESSDIYITGYTTKSINISSLNTSAVTIKYKKNGVQKWAKTYESGLEGSVDKAFGIILDKDNIYITGQTASRDSGLNYFTLKYNSSGSADWLSIYDGPGHGDDYANSITVLHNGKVVVTGASWGIYSDFDFATLIMNKNTGKVLDTYRYTMNSHSNDFAKDITSRNNDFYITGYSELNQQSPEGGASSIITLKYLGGDDQEDAITNAPAKFTLHQNYPNPFNPSTNIKFDISNRSFVKLVVYDLLGKVVDVMVDQELEAGSYSLTYKNSSLSSGVYFYKLTAGNFTDVKKMSLIK